MIKTIQDNDNKLTFQVSNGDTERLSIINAANGILRKYALCVVNNYPGQDDTPYHDIGGSDTGRGKHGRSTRSGY
jgi:hypothetical protein